jgi:hypothetical protein
VRGDRQAVGDLRGGVAGDDFEADLPSRVVSPYAARRMPTRLAVVLVVSQRKLWLNTLMEGLPAAVLLILALN